MSRMVFSEKFIFEQLLKFYFFSGVRFNRRSFPPLCYTTEDTFFKCEIQGKRFSFGAGYATEQFQDFSWQIFFCCFQQSRGFFPVVSHTGVVFLPLYPTAQKNILQCIPKYRRFCSVVGYSAGKLYNTKQYLFISKGLSMTSHENLDKSRYFSMQIMQTIPWR